MIKLFLTYLITILLVTMISGTLAYYFYPLLINDEHNTNRYISDIAMGFFIGLVTLGMYLAIFRKLRKKGLIYSALACMVFATLVWLIPASLTFGFRMSGALFFLLSYGIGNFLIPFIESVLSRWLGINPKSP